MQPDSVTLIFEDYTGGAKGDMNVSKMTKLIKEVQIKLELRGQTVNVAFDFALIDVSDRESLMNDLRQLLIRGNDGKKIVENVLVFLERPTTEAKKRLRARMERGDFRGEERSTVLRSIIPIVPPSGHKAVKQRALKGETTQEFSQYLDDVVYFQDNFAGIGFWPIPDQASPETPMIKKILSQEWNTPGPFGVFQPKVDQGCTWACPRRAKFALGTMAVLAVVLALTAGSFYSGLTNRIAFKFGLVRIGWAAIVAMLVVLLICDHHSKLPEWILIGLGIVFLAYLAFSASQRLLNGPKP